jgi:hypothetical protein
MFFVKLTDLYPKLAELFFWPERNFGTWQHGKSSAHQRYLVLPGNRPKSSKGPGEKKLAGRICGRNLAEFCQKRQKKRGRRKMSKEVPYFFFSNDKLSETKQNLIF